ncbi:acid sphingomyelinase-like phosphodiesterase 3a isoform X1 [Dendroctonus ponderosae]|uniref:acid sphingomyelinase-like phosphodiesterase 3a isoform X1 n=1 Tax=Dendroctonus ponderosae TaxID=77166 RepID=UPI002035F1BF|nr:acid sphingomyelinase-like phosphodiesterase 3a isoform X1 [Dendroctonus ponderosae]
MIKWWFSFVGLFLTVVARRDDFDRIGYFWQITDIHYDPQVTLHGDYKKGCVRHENMEGSSSSRNGNKGPRRLNSPNENLGTYGEYHCDSTWELIESAAKFMKSKQSDNIEFVLWTGDGLSHFAIKHLSENHQLELVKALTDLLGKTFPAQFVFPALGHDDPPFEKRLGKMWSKWLPTDSIKTFETGGYYIIERKPRKLHIVVLNTDLMRRSDTDEDASKQWKWLEGVLNKFEQNKEKVYLVGHVAPGRDERQRGLFSPAHKAYTSFHNQKYIEIIRNYSRVIAGQFFGHLHSDTFRIMHDKNGRPISWAMIAPSITPKRNHVGPNNPSLRLYKFNKDTGQVFDYSQYYMDLSESNLHAKAEWVVEYNFTSYYGINEITSENLHHLARKFVNSDQEITSLFERYHRANTVKVLPHPRDECDLSCVHNHYCAITHIDYRDFEDCIKRTALTRSAAERHLSSFSALFVITVLVILSSFP